MSKTVSRLGRGLSSLIHHDAVVAAESPPNPSVERNSDSVTPSHGAPGHLSRVMMVPITLIRTNPMQPRRAFDDAKLMSLAESIRQRGTLQPILVRPADAGYELVAGERRLRAAQIAGIGELPAIVRNVRDDELLELALIENIQRAELNPVERGRAYQTLAEKYRLSHEDISKRIGEDRATVSNYIRLLSLSDAVLEMVANGELSTGHAKAIAGITDQSVQFEMASKAVTGKWSVRQAEVAVAKLKATGQGPKPSDARPTVKDLEERLSSAMGTRVRIKEGRKRHSGRVVIEYYNLDDFERITARLGVSRGTA